MESYRQAFNDALITMPDSISFPFATTSLYSWNEVFEDVTAVLNKV